MIDDDDLTEVRIRQLLTEFAPPTRPPDIDELLRAGRQRSAWHAWDRGLAAVVIAVLVVGAGLLAVSLAGHGSERPLRDPSLSATPTPTASGLTTESPGAIEGVDKGYVCYTATRFTVLPHGLSHDQLVRFLKEHVRPKDYFDKTDPKAVWRIYDDPAEPTTLADGSPRPLPSWWANLTPVGPIGLGCRSAAPWPDAAPSGWTDSGPFGTP
jgi:hypothetical protein